MKWVDINKEEYFKMFKNNMAYLTCFSSCTDSDYVMTEWGYKGSGRSFIKAIDTLYGDEWEYKYYKAE